MSDAVMKSLAQTWLESLESQHLKETQKAHRPSYVRITSVVVLRDDSAASVYTQSEPASATPQKAVLSISEFGNKALS